MYRPFDPRLEKADLPRGVGKRQIALDAARIAEQHLTLRLSCGEPLPEPDEAVRLRLRSAGINVDSLRIGARRAAS